LALATEGGVPRRRSRSILMTPRIPLVDLVVRPGTLLLAGCAALLPQARASADYVGIFWELDAFALDEVTLLSDLPGYAGQRVYNIYAEFDNASDQAVGVVGTPLHPFSVFTSDPAAGFFNVPPSEGGANTPPSSFAAGLVPALNWDSFFTVGTKVSDPFGTPGNDALVIAPGTPGPPDAGKWGAGPIGTNMAWTLPPTNSLGMPQPVTLAFPDGRVLLMRLAVDDQSIGIEGSFGLLVFEDGVGSEAKGSFLIRAPSPGALPLLLAAALGGRRRRRRGQ
jgi:hypothetical protein